MKPVSKILVLAAFLVSCSSAEIEKTPSDFSVAPNVILDTDIGNSLDDLVALDILHHYCRKILAKADDKSVTILSIGFLTNISRLLESRPGVYSSLSGVDLVKRKVRSVVAMCDSQKEVEYNVSYDISSARNVFGKLPVSMSIIPGETGMPVQSEEIFEHTAWADLHPVALAYTTHDKADMNMCWDAVAGLAYVTGFSDVTISDPYDATINEKGMMELTGNPYGRFRVLSLSPDQQLRNKELLLNILGTRID